MNRIIAIDPGAAGGIAIKLEDIVDCYPMPETHGEIISILKDTLDGTRIPTVCYIEELVKHMGAGIPASAMAVYATNYGFILGALQMAGFKIVRVRPQDWQKVLGLGVTAKQRAKPGMSAEERKSIQRQNAQSKRDWKNKLLGKAQELYPRLRPTLKTADALLLLNFAERMERSK